MSIRYKVVQSHLKDSVSSPRRSATPRPSRQRPSHDDCWVRLAKASECTRRAYFFAQRAIASISREKSWKVAEKNIHASPLRPLRLGEKKLATVVLF